MPWAAREGQDGSLVDMLDITSSNRGLWVLRVYNRSPDETSFSLGEVGFLLLRTQMPSRIPLLFQLALSVARFRCIPL